MAGSTETSINLIKRLKNNFFIDSYYSSCLQRIPRSTLYKGDSIGLDLSMIALGNFFYYVSWFNFYILSPATGQENGILQRCP
jgi:hypothetical protein